MKKLFKVIAVIMAVVAVYFSCIAIINTFFCKAYLDDDFKIHYNGKIYCLYRDLFDYDVMDGEPDNVTGILTDSALDYILFPREYIYYSDDTVDKNTDFIVYESLTTLVFVEENFTFPDIKEDAIEEVWLTMDTDIDGIDDKSVVKEIVMCAKDGEKRPLNEKIFNLITEYDGDNIFLKFKGYPIVANFKIETTKDGIHYLKECDEQDIGSKYTVFF